MGPAAAERSAFTVTECFRERELDHLAGGSGSHEASTDQRAHGAESDDLPVHGDRRGDADELLEHHPGDQVADHDAERQTDHQRGGGDTDSDPTQPAPELTAATTERPHHRDFTRAFGDERVRGRGQQDERDESGEDTEQPDQRADLLDVLVDRRRAVGHHDRKSRERVARRLELGSFRVGDRSQ